MRRCGYLVLLLTLFFLVPGAKRGSCASPALATVPFETLVGEELRYDISFLWFDRVAEGRISLSAGEEPGTYHAVLEAGTLGFAAWLSRHRVQRYETLMTIGEDGLLIPLYHESHLIKGEGDSQTHRVKRYSFDHDRGAVVYEKGRAGEFYDKKILHLEPGPSYDILSAFYNFRAGRFGPVEQGTRYVLPTFSRKGRADILVELHDAAQEVPDPFFPNQGLIGRVKLDGEVFDTHGGDVFVWFDAAGRPVRGMVESVIGVGDVKGIMR